eukprot:gene18846-24631_t
MFGSPAIADDELAKFAADGNTVGVDGQCFLRKCSLETAKCANDPTCLKGLSCLARCKGGSLCSTGCFAKYGSDKLDDILYCSVEKNDCVHVPGKEKTGWIEDTLADLPSKPIQQFDIKSLDGTWPSFPGYLQNKIVEELHRNENSKSLSTLQSHGQMFGLTFWENWYILGDTNVLSKANQNPLGHTLQGSYKGAFLYARSPKIDDQDLMTEADVSKDAPFWYLGQRFFQVTNQIGNELADWFEDPALLSDWLVSQQEHVILNKPLAVSPFASLGED